MSKDPVERIAFSSNVSVSLIIPHFYPSRQTNLQKLLAELRRQTYQNFEVLIVHGVSPQGRAINLGAKAAKGCLLMVMDDDTQLDQPNLIQNLAETLDNDPNIAMAGASIISPPDGLNGFQRAAAKQFPRFHMPVVDKITESDLPCHGCAAFRRDVFEQVGMERDNILRGLDPDLRVRIRKAGYRVVLVPNAWVYHPFPASIGKFIRLFFRNGYGSAYLQTFYPEINYDTDEAAQSDGFVPKRSFAYRIFRFPVRLFKSLFALQWIRFLGYFVYALGYAVGLLKFSLTGRK